MRPGVLKGFSLIEMLVVLAIMGLLVSVVGFSVRSPGNDSADAGVAGERLARLMTAASDEAVLRMTPIGLGLAPSQQGDDEQWTLSWLIWQQNNWIRLDDFLPTLYLSSLLSSGSLSVEGELLSDAQLRRAHASGLPVLVFYPTGESTLFTLSLPVSQNQPRAVTLTNMDTGLIVKVLQ